MNAEIGTAAGKVYRFLDKNRGSDFTMSKLKSGTGISGSLFDQAIGWLAREGKLSVERKGRALAVSLKE
jgi:hypothetical protein